MTVANVLGNGQYMTVQGDTFDLIAKQIYGDERRMDLLIEANPDHAKTVIFGAGIALVLPLPKTSSVSSGYPPWRKP